MVRNIITAVMTLMGFSLYSQIDCNILLRYPDETVFYNDTTLCYNSELTLYTAFSLDLDYSWEPNGETTYSIDVKINDTTTYILNVYNDDSTFHCTDTVTLNVYPRIVVEFEQLVYGCPPADTIDAVDTICKAQVKVNVSEGYPPYHYNWGDSIMVNYGDSSWALNLCVLQTYTVIISDTVCDYTETYDVQAFDMPEIEITINPDSLFITNPQALLTFENKSADSVQLTSWAWIFPNGTSTNQLSPSYVFTKNDSIVKFTYTTLDNCNDTIFIQVKVYDFELTIPNVFTPNGDGVNDRYEIPYLDRYITSELHVFNRWGNLVYKGSNYSGDWDGGKLPDGVYFYVLKCKGYWEEKVFRGSVSIYGSRY